MSPGTRISYQLSGDQGKLSLLGHVAAPPVLFLIQRLIVHAEPEPIHADSAVILAKRGAICPDQAANCRDCWTIHEDRGAILLERPPIRTKRGEIHLGRLVTQMDRPAIREVGAAIHEGRRVIH